MLESSHHPAAYDRCFVLGPWQVDPCRNSVHRPDRCLRLEPKLMAVLTHLAAAHGAIVTKTELLDRVWPRRYVVEGVLKRAVSELRRILGDDARDPRYIETVHRVGYRLVAPAHACDDAPPGACRVVSGTNSDIRRALARLERDLPTGAHLTLIVSEGPPASPLERRSRDSGDA